jgi:hypothetical protein
MLLFRRGTRLSLLEWQLTVSLSAELKVAIQVVSSHTTSRSVGIHRREWMTF